MNLSRNILIGFFVGLEIGAVFSPLNFTLPLCWFVLFLAAISLIFGLILVHDNVPPICYKMFCFRTLRQIVYTNGKWQEDHDDEYRLTRRPFDIAFGFLIGLICGIINLSYSRSLLLTCGVIGVAIIIVGLLLECLIYSKN